MDERDIERLMGQDLSAGTEEFRDRLLGRCLSVLRTKDDYRVLDDDELDMLAAAGTVDAMILADSENLD